MAKKVDGQYIFRDNYMKYVLKEDIEAYVHDIAEKYFGKCKAFLRFSNYRRCLPESFPTDATAEDFLKAEEDCYFVVFVSPGHISLQDAKEEFKEYKSQIEKCEFENIGSTVYILPDAESFEKTDSPDGPTGNFQDKMKYDCAGSI